MIADSMPRPNLLYIVHRFPFPPDKGDRIRAFHIIRHLARHSNLWVAALDDEGVSAARIAELEKMVSRVKVVPVNNRWRLLGIAGRILNGKSISESAFFSSELRKLLQSWSRSVEFDAVMISASSLASYLAIFNSANTKKVVDFVDVDSEKWRQYAASCRGPRRLLFQREYRHVKRLEQSLLQDADAVTLVSSEEAQLLEKSFRDQPLSQHHLRKIHAISNGVDLAHFSPVDMERSRSLCFSGAMDYRPNVDAVVWFVDKVWPHLHRVYPDLKLNIVGRNPSPPVNRLRKTAGVHVTGTVPDVRPWMAQALAVVAPLRIARGIQNKVLEAMAMGRAVVASPEALTGLRAEPDVNVLEAAAPDEWYFQIRKILQSPDERNRLERAARIYVEDHHSWNATLGPLGKILPLQRREASIQQ